MESTTAGRAGFLLDNLSNGDFSPLEIPPVYVPDIDVVTEDAQQVLRLSVEEEKEDAQATSTCFLGSVETEGTTLNRKQSEVREPSERTKKYLPALERSEPFNKKKDLTVTSKHPTTNEDVVQQSRAT